MHVGMDYGSAMIRAAATDAAAVTPSEFTWSGRSGKPTGFLPAAVSYAVDDMSCGWTAYRQRARPDELVAWGFRDRTFSAQSKILVGGRTRSAVDLHSALLGHVWSEISDRYNEVDSLTVSVPDDLSPHHWAIASGFGQIGIEPTLFVRDWACVICQEEQLTNDTFVMLSIGFGAARATVCRLEGDAWITASTVRDETVSGERLRERVLDVIAEDVISSLRKDPRESPQSLPALRMALDRSIATLCRKKECDLKASMFDTVYEGTIERTSLAGYVPDFRTHLVSLVEEALSKSGLGIGTCPIMAWGELANILPVANWLAGLSPLNSPVDVKSLYSVARGAASIGAASLSEGIGFTEGVSLEDGKYITNLGDSAAGGDAVPVCSSLPSRLIDVIRLPKPELVLVGADGEQTRILLDTHRFRLGRDDRSDWVFKEEHFPGVSNAHAVIVRDGSDFLVKDLDSSNGTYVNGRRIPQKILEHQDVIRLGRDGPRVRFELGSG